MPLQLNGKLILINFPDNCGGLTNVKKNREQAFFLHSQRSSVHSSDLGNVQLLCVQVQFLLDFSANP